MDEKRRSGGGRRRFVHREREYVMRLTVLRPAIAVLACALRRVLPPSPAAADTPDWSRPAKPFRVVGPVHFVGTSELGVFLVTTPAGHVLIDGGAPESTPLIEASIRALGFDPREIRVLLTTQAHYDHVGSLAHFKRLSGGRVEVMDGDVALVESGGQADYLFGAGGTTVPVRSREGGPHASRRRHRCARRRDPHRAAHTRPHARQHHLA